MKKHNDNLPASTTGSITTPNFRFTITIPLSMLEVRGNIMDILRVLLGNYMIARGYKISISLSPESVQFIDMTTNELYVAPIPSPLRELIATYKRYTSGHLYCQQKQRTFWFSFKNVPPHKPTESLTTNTNTTK